MSFKVQKAAQIITAELAKGHTCVVGLTSTSEAAQRRAEEEDCLEDFSGLQQGARRAASNPNPTPTPNPNPTPTPTPNPTPTQP